MDNDQKKPFERILSKMNLEKNYREVHMNSSICKVQSNL